MEGACPTCIHRRVVNLYVEETQSDILDDGDDGDDAPNCHGSDTPNDDVFEGFTGQVTLFSDDSNDGELSDSGHTADDELSDDD
jgi:hypothetical protein